MGKNLVFHRVKRHLTLANNVYCVFVNFDRTSNKIITISKKKERIVVTFRVLQFLIMTAKIFSVAARTTNLIEKIVGIAMTSITLTPFLLRCHTFADYVQVQFLNYIFLSRGCNISKNY